MASHSSANLNKQNGSQGSQGSHKSFKDLSKEGEGNQGGQAPDLSDVRGFAVPMSEVENGSQHDGESVREMFLNAKAEYEGLVRYFTGQRQAFVDGMNEKLSQAQTIIDTLQHINPQGQVKLQALILERQQLAEQDRAQLEHFDNLVEPTRQEIWNTMASILHAGPGGNMNDLVHEFHWPTMEVCQDLNLPLDYQYMISGTYNASTVIRDALGQVQVQEGPQESAETLYLKNRIAVLEAQVQKSDQRKVITKPTEAKEQEKKLDPIFLERRRRHRFKTFDKGTPFEAQQWMGRFEVLADYLGFTNKEKTEELAAVFEGHSLDWFIGLEPTVKQDWEKVKQAFLHMHAHGSDPTLVAFDELKAYTQGDKPMKVFGPGLTSLLHRAGIYSPSIQLEYLKERLSPLLEQAVILRGPNTLEEGIKIATEIERSLARAKKTVSMGPIQYQPEPAATDGEQQNYQQRYDNKKSEGSSRFGNGSDNKFKDRKCFKCGKKGHIKKDCWSKREQKQNNQEVQGSGVSKVQDSGDSKVQGSGDSYEEDEVDIFAHIMNNNNQEVKTTTGGNRFKMQVTGEMDGWQQDVLVDTGSTISTISRAAVKKLGLQEFACQEQLIRYGNTSTQMAASKVVLNFKFNKHEASRAYLLVVPNQNEEVILGMDWLEKEDMVLHPRHKTVSRSPVHSSNNADLMVEEILKKFPKVTEETEEQTVTTAPYSHSIDTGTALPTVTYDFRRSPAETEAIKKEVEMMLKKGVIVPSNSDWCSPVVLIKKPDGSFRLCVDYRKLNKVTVKDKFPLPLISDLLERFEGYKYFTTCDLKSGFWQLPLNKDDGSAKKTAFQAGGSLYEWVSMPYGCVNGPSSFSRLMSIVMKDLPNAVFFCDDACIFSKTLEDHKKDVERFLERLDRYNLKINPKKCQWFQQEVKFLGFLVSGEGIRSNPDKVKVVKDWQPPVNKKGLLRFLGFAVFYHRFIDSLSTKAKPLYALLKKDVDYVWSKEAQQAFDVIKQELVSLPTLAYPNPQLPYDLHCDASDVGLGACVVQQGRPIAYASRTLNSAESNYTTTEKECLAVVWSLKQFHPYLYGSKFTIYTDHAALRSILSVKTPKGRLARWIMDLQEYQPYEVVHKKGVLNVDADALSRIADVNAQDFSFQDITVAMFQDLQKVDPTVKFIKSQGVQKPYVFHNGVVCYQEADKLLPVVPVGLIEQILVHAHSKSTGGHFGVDKTLAKVKEIGWWPNMQADVEFWVKSCEGCQRFKVRSDSQRHPMKPITPNFVGEVWATDIAILPESMNGERYLLVIMEYLTKWVVAVPLKSFDTGSIVQVLLYEVVLKFGLPKRLLSDNGTNYISEAMNMVCSRLGISRSLTSVEHPQSDGLVERMNRTLKTSLSIVVGSNVRTWSQHLPFVVFAYNTARQASTKFSPFEVMFGRKAVLPLLPSLEVVNPKTYTAQQWGEYLNEEIPIIHAKALENIRKAQEQQVKQYNKKARSLVRFKVGDLVLRKNHKMMSFPKERWTGPWKVLSVNNKAGTAYKIGKVEDPKATSTVNVVDLRLFIRRGNDVVYPATDGASTIGLD